MGTPVPAFDVGLRAREGTTLRAPGHFTDGIAPAPLPPREPAPSPVHATRSGSERPRGERPDPAAARQVAPVRVVCVTGGDGLDAGRAVRLRMALRPLPRGVEVAVARHGALPLREALVGAGAVVVVDRLQLGAPDGTVHVLDWREVPPAWAVGDERGAVLGEAMQVAELLEPASRPSRAFLVGVEGGGPGTLDEATRIALELAAGLAQLDAGAVA
jgi:hydrogenase maturation protease